jgi:hypothetical protein
VAVTFDPDDYELRWPPQLFVDEADRLRRRKVFASGDLFGRGGWAPDMEWLLTEAFVSTVPMEAFKAALRSGGWGGPRQPGLEAWVSELIRQAAKWLQPGTRKPYWSARTTGRTRRLQLDLGEVSWSYVQLIEEFEADGYLVQAFGKKCVDDDSPRPDPSAVLEGRLGYDVFGWPLEPSRAGWELDDFCDLVEVFHDLVARPSSRSYHSYASCGWHYWDFATGPARRLYRWRVNRLLASSTLGLRLAEEGEDLGRLVRVEPTGLEDLPEKAMQAATPEAIDRVQHAIALFRSRTAGVEERRSAVITLAGILEERRSLLKAELLTKDEGALFTIANQFCGSPPAGESTRGLRQCLPRLAVLVVPRDRPADGRAPGSAGLRTFLTSQAPSVEPCRLEAPGRADGR